MRGWNTGLQKTQDEKSQGEQEVVFSYYGCPKAREILIYKGHVLLLSIQGACAAAVVGDEVLRSVIFPNVYLEVAFALKRQHVDSDNNSPTRSSPIICHVNLTSFLQAPRYRQHDFHVHTHLPQCNLLHQRASLQPPLPHDT